MSASKKHLRLSLFSGIHWVFYNFLDVFLGDVLFTFLAYPTVDGRNPPPVELGSLAHYLQGFTYPR